MAKTNPTNTPAQGGGSAEQNLLSDLDRSELTEARNDALKDSQSTDPNAPNYLAPKEDDAKQPEAELLEAKTPEWVQTILDSNQAVLDSNQKVVDALEDLKLFDADRSSNQDGPVKTKVLAEDQFDEDADYEVAEGKSFRDSKDFSIEYKAGKDVTHLGADRLKVLLSQGLVQEA